MDLEVIRHSLEECLKVFAYKKSKVPYCVVVGGREQENRTVSIKTRDGVAINGIELETFIKLCTKQISEKNIKLVDKLD